jgi:plastocyanin
MHALAISLLAAADFHEKSKTAFYILGGLLAAWALLVSFAGLREADFPATPQLARAVMGISIALPVATAAAAVLTASVPPSAGAYLSKRAADNGAKGQTSPPTLVAGGGATQGAGAAPGGGAPPSGGPVEIDADPSGQLAYVQKTVTVKPGKVTFKFVNRSPLPHNLTIVAGSGGALLGATPTITGNSANVAVSLKPGSYTFYCSVPGHREAGMTGTLTVQ